MAGYAPCVRRFSGGPLLQITGVVLVKGKLKWLIPLLAVLALAGWWLIPHFSSEDKAYYVAVFCGIDHHETQRLLPQMQQIIEGSNSDYALQKITFKPALGRQVIDHWQQLSADEQRQAATDNLTCQQLLQR